MLDLVFTLSENEIIYYYPKYIMMLHDLMIKLSKSLSEISRRYKIRQPTKEEIAESYQLAMPSKPQKKKPQSQEPEAEAETVEVPTVAENPEPPKQTPAAQAIPKVKKEPTVKIKTRIQDTQRVIQDLTKQLKEEETRIERFYIQKAPNQIKKIYNEIMTKGKVTKENLQTFVQYLKTTKEATSRQMSKSGGIDRVTLGNYTIGAHAPHKGETHLDKGALADIRKTLIAFYKDQAQG
jgi:polyhydroxyalkanoate synthesis regulator phasin